MIVPNHTRNITLRTFRVAVLLPCYNEEKAITQVVHGFLAALPQAIVYVYDNNSNDLTVQNARDAGAMVRNEPRQGKGNVIRRMFADIDADIYVLADGDDTYDPHSAPDMINKLVDERLDMVVGARVSHDVKSTYRTGHVFGNHILTSFVGFLFGRSFTDILTGYRVFSRRFVKSFPALATGFETETELTIHALELRMPTAEISTAYKQRPAGSQSKLRTYRDGIRIMLSILRLFKEE
jgi:glycosyltransferase involved in cell wall biosynthesis